MLLWSAIASAAPCTPTTMGNLAATPSPSILVLGVRHGTQPDLYRADRLVRRLLRAGQPVTVALDALPTSRQSVLDRYSNGDIEGLDLPGELDWNAQPNFPYSPYEGLVTSALRGASVVAIGARFQPGGTDPVPTPTGYAPVLADTMAGAEMPPALEAPFVRSVARLDHALATHAFEGWSGKGVLVVVVDRTRVEGGKGVAWQLERMTEAPVTPVLTGGPGACYAGDQYL